MSQVYRRNIQINRMIQRGGVWYRSSDLEYIVVGEQKNSKVYLWRQCHVLERLLILKMIWVWLGNMLWNKSKLGLEMNAL